MVSNQIDNNEAERLGITAQFERVTSMVLETVLLWDNLNGNVLCEIKLK